MIFNANQKNGNFHRRLSYSQNWDCFAELRILYKYAEMPSFLSEYQYYALPCPLFK
jgi:hypothetical protein